MPNNTGEPDNPNPPTPPATLAPTLRQQVAQLLANSGPKVREIVVNKLADEEVQRQVDSAIKAVAKIHDLERDLAKIRPMPTLFDEQGKPIGPAGFTKEQIEQRKQINEKLNRLHGALQRALEESNFDKLHEAVKS